MGELVATPFFSPELDRGSTDPRYARIHRPAVTLSLVLGHRLGGGSPGAFHAIALLAHLLAVALAFRFLRRRGLTPRGAAVGALLFGVHPTRLESVAWISGLSDTLMALFSLLAAEAAAWTKRDAPDAGREARGILAVLVASFLAFASKEPALALAPTLVALEWLDEGFGAARARRAVLASGVGVTTGLGLALFVSRHAPPATLQPDLPKIFATFGSAVHRIAWPFPPTSEPYLQTFAADGGRVLPPAFVALGVVAMVVVGAAALQARKGERDRAWAGAALVYLAGLIPALGWTGRVMHGFVQDRLLYVPLLGVGWALGVALDRVESRAAGWLAVAILLATVPHTMEASALFGDEAAWQAAEAARRPDDPGLCIQGATGLLSRGDFQGATSTALECAERASRRHDRGAEATSLVLAAVATTQGWPDAPMDEARALRQALVAFDESGQLRVDLGGESFEVDLPRGGRDHESLRAQPRGLRLTVAHLSVQLREFDVALEHTRPVIASFPRVPDAWLTHLTALARSRRYEEARSALAAARQAVPAARALFDGFGAALDRAVAAENDPRLEPWQRRAAASEMLLDPYGVLLALGERCRRPVNAALAGQCARAATALRREPSGSATE